MLGGPVATEMLCDEVRGLIVIIEKEDREFRTADSVFALSSVARDSMMRCGVPAEKIFVNPSGVDFSAFRPC